MREALFKAIVTNLETLRDAYSRVGLLTDSGQGSLASTFLGGDEAADRFPRPGYVTIQGNKPSTKAGQSQSTPKMGVICPIPQ